MREAAEPGDNGGTRAQQMHAMQRTYGNRVVQRQVESSSMQSIYAQWMLTGMMGQEIGRAVDQEHDMAVGDAQRAITGRQPSWPAMDSPMTGPVPIPFGEYQSSGTREFPRGRSAAIQRRFTGVKHL
jgi:hypothetical protein